MSDDRTARRARLLPEALTCLLDDDARLCGILLYDADVAELKAWLEELGAPYEEDDSEDEEKPS